MLLQTIVNGALTGGLTAIIALGLSLLIGVLRLINLAHGEFIVGSAYVAFLLTQVMSMPLLAAIPVTIAVAMLVGYIVQRGLFTPLLERGGADGPLVASFGLSLVLQGVFVQFFTNDSRALASDVGSAGVDLLPGVRVRAIYLIAFLVAVALTLAIWLVLHRTRVGAAVRAAAADPVTAQTQGIDVNRLFAWVMAVCAGVAAIGGVVIGVSSGFGPASGQAILLAGMVVVVLGGVGNVIGTLVASLLVGVLTSLLNVWLGGGFQNIVVYVLFLVVLALRPQGIFPTKGVRA
ncbi:branched-chain amino acid ABC transporter permease [Microbacterium ulmi]|uniref:Branched-chain amino acid ABC transporter permease n=1 Tax=Microbacterium ulmi TaxID=179095 RepID=A0A7Y2PZ12_9MICO|nr:branched-chain amino acid ABC transporter permease [Microbacterium ulmi]NII68973.1 branched-chain amino acid transport system permease protein [Microbacterium ulmi]NNH03956.1 branched-chain amino acid ABC transporter permease [Microbacterium ulmi]